MDGPANDDILVLLEDGAKGHARLFRDPVDVVACHGPADAEAAMARIEEGLAGGLFAAGWLAYELGHALEPRLRPLAAACPVPLIWMGLFRRQEILEGESLRGFWAGQPGGAYDLGEPTLDTSEEDYLANLGRIKDYLAAGDAYQVTYTARLRFEATGDLLALYRTLSRAQPVSHGAFIKTPEATVLSFSPELFVERRGRVVTCRPMKGTMERGVDGAADAVQRAALAADGKNRAENLMIVDLVRNDLSRIAEVGSVRTSNLFQVETYRTLLQMTSTVKAEVDPGVSLGRMLQALFPCGSITGAPKIRAMEIIGELERTPRGVYAGAIGFAAPSGDARFNVAIRTVVVQNGIAEMGVGGGIVADSDPQAEYRECLLKARFLTHPMPDFQLIETMYWSAREGVRHRGRHLERLAASTAYFQFPYRLVEAEAMLDQHIAASGREAPLRLRLLLDRDGYLSLTSSKAPPPPAGGSVVVSKKPSDSGDPFFYHKTTHRPLYDGELARARAAGHLDVLFFNQRGELTEGARSNVFVQRGGVLFTPPLGCGLLAGTLRGHLLAAAGVKIEEAVLGRDDLKKADRIYLGNGVMGLVEVRLASF